MNNLEQRIRELPRQDPSEALDGRIAALLAPAPGDGRTPPARRPSLTILAATALAAGLAGFAAGIGTGQWITAPPGQPILTDHSVRPSETVDESQATTLVRLTDARIGAGLDFSQSLEPFHLQPVEQEGS